MTYALFMQSGLSMVQRFALWALLLLLACGESQKPTPTAALTFSPAARVFVRSLAVEISSQLPDAEIHYTVDGRLPTASDPIARGAIQLEATTELRAIAIGPAGSSEVLTSLYVQADEESAAFSSNLPIVVLHMLGGTAPRPEHNDYLRAALLIISPNQGVSTPVSPHAEASRAGIKVRGRSTRFDAKHSFALETWGAVDQQDEALPLLGMPSESDWVLYAPFTYDRSYMHNALMYALSHDVGRYAARTRFVELFLVEGDRPLRMTDYRGLFVFMERLKRDSQRIAVAKLSGSDRTQPAITGGYIVKADDPGPGEAGFEAAGFRLAHVYPDEEDLNISQREYIRQYFEEVETAIGEAARDGANEQAPYRSLIDMDSFIDHHILNVFAKNPDALRLSSYFQKDLNGPLAAGPIWDFDRALGSITDGRAANPVGWSADGDGTRVFQYALWSDLFALQAFRAAYIARLQEMLAGPLSTARVHAHIHRFAAEIGEAAERDAARWPEARPLDGRFDNEVQSLLRWTAERLQWLSANAQSAGQE